jgi:hypothetical protein
VNLNSVRSLGLSLGSVKRHIAGIEAPGSRAVLRSERHQAIDLPVRRVLQCRRQACAGLLTRVIKSKIGIGVIPGSESRALNQRQRGDHADSNFRKNDSRQEAGAR